MVLNKILQPHLSFDSLLSTVHEVGCYKGLVLSHTEFWRIIFAYKNHSSSPGAGHTGAELWPCLDDWSQLLRHINMASGIQLCSPQ